MPASLEIMDAILERQKEPWHSPNIASVRNFMLSIVMPAPSFLILSIASTTSPSVTSLHMQTTLPYCGFRFMRCCFSESERREKRFIPFLKGFHLSFSAMRKSSFSSISFATYSAIEGAAVRPGERMPATFTNPHGLSYARIIYFPPGGSGRSPANIFETLFLGGSDARNFRAFSHM